MNQTISHNWFDSFEGLPVAVSIVNPSLEDEFLFVNSEWIELSGFSNEESKAIRFIDRIHPEDRSFVLTTVADAWEKKQASAKLEYRWQKSNGNYFWIESRIKFLKKEKKHTTVAVFCSREITERKKAEKKFQETESLFKTAFKTHPDSININRLSDGIYIDVNEGFSRLTGFSRQEVVGKSSLDIHIWHDENDRIKLVNLLKKEGKAINLEAKFKKKNGDIQTGLMSASIILLNKIPHILSVTRNIEDFKRMEVQLQQSQKMEAIGTLAGGIAHDFNNILSGIFGFSHLAKNNLNDPEKANDHIDQIINGARKASELVQQILTISHKSKPEKNIVAAYLIVKEAIKLLRASLPSFIHIKEHIVSKATVMADPVKIHQIVMNLCINAYHAIGEKEGMIAIGLTRVNIAGNDFAFGLDVVPGTYLKLEVSDTGHGIEKKNLEKIFDPYFTTKDVGKGSGLGLAVVRGIVNEHKGHIKVYTDVDKGSSFHVFLPVVDKPARKISIPESAKNRVTGGNERILLVDDNLDIIAATKALLEGYGYRVSAFDQSIAALEKFMEDPFGYDLVITDLTMPKMTGSDLAKKILKVRPDLPIIVCSGHSGLINKAHLIQMGIKDYIEKPVITENVVTIVRNTLDKNKNKV